MIFWCHTYDDDKVAFDGITEDEKKLLHAIFQKIADDLEEIPQTTMKKGENFRWNIPFKSFLSAFWQAVGQA